MARVLVVDDDPAVAKLLRLVLEAAGHEVLIANDGSRGLALALRQPPDLVFLDILMSGMSGTATLRALADDPRTQAIPVVVVSALSRDEVGGIPDDVEIAAYVRKPFTASALVELAARLTAVRRTA